MIWFERYGIPGVYFCGMWMLWALSFYHCAGLQVLAVEGSLGAIAGIVGALFLPTGYLLSVMQQLVYLRWRIPPLGITARAMAQSGLFAPESIKNKQQYWLEAQACLLEIGATIGNGCKKSKPSARTESGTVTPEASRFLQDWVRSRNDVMVIDASMMLATLLAPILVLAMKCPLDVTWNLNASWLALSALLSIILILILLCSWRTMRSEVEEIEAGIYRILAGQPASKVKLKSAPQSENAGIGET